MARRSTKQKARTCLSAFDGGCVIGWLRYELGTPRQGARCISSSSDVVQAVTYPYLRLNFEYEVATCQDERIWLSERRGKLGWPSFVEGDEEEPDQPSRAASCSWPNSARGPSIKQGSFDRPRKVCSEATGPQSARKPGTGADADEVMEELGILGRRPGVGRRTRAARSDGQSGGVAGGHCCTM